MSISLAELATRLGVPWRGAAEVALTHVAQLDQAESGSLSFLGDPAYRPYLATTRAAAVIVKPSDAAGAPVPLLLSDNPYLTFAQAAQLLHPEPEVVGGIHPSAVVDPSAQVDPSAWIGPLSVLEAGASVGPRVFVGPSCILGAGVSIGADSRLVARVTLCAGTQIGERALIHPGAVIGRAGFGFAKDGERWVRIPQLGRAVLGDDVEVGANTTVDRGAMRDTVLGHGVKLDNLIQIGHNVVVGDHTAMAAKTGISGSTQIGRHCTLAGAVGVVGHLEIGDNVHFTGMTMVTRSFKEPGVYSSGIPAMPSADWRRNVARLKQLDTLTRRVKQLETLLANMNATPEREESEWMEP